MDVPDNRSAFAPGNKMKIFRSFLLAVVFLFLIATSVSAHSTLIRSEPERDARLEASPGRIELWFNEELGDPSTLRVMDSESRQIDNGDGGINLNDLDHLTMTVSVPELPDGIYTVRWTASSAEDGDTTSGGFNFQIGDAPPPARGIPGSRNLLWPLAASTAGVFAAVLFIWNRQRKQIRE